MGIKHAHIDLLDKGIDHLKNNVTRIALIKAYVKGDSFAVVTGAGNILAEIATTATDFTIASVGDDRRVTSAAKSATAGVTVASGFDLHFAFLTADSRVLYVTDETSNMATTSGNTVNFPALTYTSVYPV